MVNKKQKMILIGMIIILVFMFIYRPYKVSDFTKDIISSAFIGDRSIKITEIEINAGYYFIWENKFLLSINIRPGAPQLAVGTFK